jgi:hypothetical protein
VKCSASPTASAKARSRTSQVGAQLVGEIAAFLHQQARQAEAGDLFRDAGEAVGGDGQAAEGIALGGVEAECDDQDVGGVGADARQGGVEGLQENRIAAAPGERQVEVRSEAGTGAALVGMTPEEGIEARRVGVDRDGQHVAALVEDPGRRSPCC